MTHISRAEDGWEKHYVLDTMKYKKAALALAYDAASGEKVNQRYHKCRSQNMELLGPRPHSVLMDRLASNDQTWKPGFEGCWAPPVADVEKRKQ